MSIISKPIEPNINIIYKSVDGFFSKKNKKNFIVNYLKNNKEKLNKKNNSKIARYLENIFLTNYDDNLKFIETLNNSDLLESDEYNAIIAIIIKINVSNSKIVITFENINDFKEIRKFIYFFKIILGKITDDILSFDKEKKNNSFQEITNKLSNSKKNSTKKIKRKI